MSDDLIARLSADLRPVSATAMRNRILVGLTAGVLIAAVAMLLWLGPRPDLAVAVATPIFWAKFAFTLALAGLGLAAAIRLSRPAGTLRSVAIAVVAVIAITGGAAVVQILTSSPDDVRRRVIGGSALRCPFYIVALSVPVLALSFAAMRRLAPTNLPAAGFAAGLLSGGSGAWVYAFHCAESGLPFVTLWYTAGILATALIGAALGRWVLRW